MVDLTFVYRDGDVPELRRPLQEGRLRFLQDGSILLEDGNVWVQDETNAWVIQSTYNPLRPISFGTPSLGVVEPGLDGLIPLQTRFRKGHVEFYDTTSTHLPLTSSPTHQWLDGRVTLTMDSVDANLTQFAVWPSTVNDPATKGYVETATALSSGGVTQSAARMSAVFVPNPAARYIGVGAKVYSVPNSGTWRTQYFKKWMVERVETGRTTPSTKYAEAREVRVVVKPDRLNYFTNNFTVDGTHLTGEPGTTLGAVTGGVLPLSNPASQTGMGFNWVSDVYLPADVWTVTWWFRSPVLRDLQIVNNSTGDDSGFPLVPALPNQWTPMSWTFSTVEDGPLLVSLDFLATARVAAGIGATGEVKDVLLERGDRVRPHFHGSTSADTIWETGKPAGRTRSYLYKNRADRYAAIKRVLKDNVPLGIGIAEPQFGVLPTD